MSNFRTIALISLMLFVWVAGRAQGNSVAPQAPAGAAVPAKWIKALPSAPCESASLGTFCHLSSPALADLTGDGRLEIIVATNRGHVLAFTGDGKTLWDRDVAPLFGLAADQQTITSSPAIGDLDGDGRPEIVVGTGYGTKTCRPGGVVVLRNDGRPLDGWPIQTEDNNIAPSDCPDPVFSTPALGDLDNDGDLEIVVGSFDHRIYAWHHDGILLDGFPGKSDLFVTMGWPNMAEQLADTIWSSPALADLDGDGYLDIVIGSDEGMVDGTFGNSNWSCPYAAPPGGTRGYCGGTLYAYDHTGEFLPGYPKHILESIQSSPAIVDGNHGGGPEVFVGTGSYYHRFSPDQPTYGQRLFGWAGSGAALPGWDGGRPTSSVLPASPVIGDIAGDAAPEIIIPSLDGSLYAWHLDGTVVAGFPMLPLNFMGDISPQDVGKSLVLGDYDGDGKMEIFMAAGWSVVIVDGNGRLLTNTKASSDHTTPFFTTNGLIQNNPALGDIDGDGVLELVVQNSELTVWDMPAGANRSEWPMFRRDAARTGADVTKHVSVDPHEIVMVGSTGEAWQVSEEVIVRIPGSAFQWKATVRSSNGVRLPVASGQGHDVVTIPLEIEWPASMGAGEHDLGTIEITVWGDELKVDAPMHTVPVRLTLIKTTADTFLPTIVGSP